MLHGSRPRRGSGRRDARVLRRSKLAGEPPEFAAIFFRNLLALAAIDHREQYLDAAQAYADQAWAQRDARTNLVSFGKSARLLDQAAIVQIYSALATARP